MLNIRFSSELSGEYVKILLIFPRIEHGQATYRDRGSWSAILFGYPPITLPHLAALTPEKHSVKIVDESYEDIDFNEDIDLVGMSCLTMTAPRVYEIADEKIKSKKERRKTQFIKIIVV